MDRVTFEARLLEVAYKTDAVLSPPVVAFRVGCPIQEAGQYLAEMAGAGILLRRQDENGHEIFEIPHRQMPTGEPLSWTQPPPSHGLQRSVLPPQPVVIAPPHQRPLQIVGQKSALGAFVLALLFGPLGMLYATVSGALIMFLLNVLIAVVTGGLGLIITVPLGALWAASAASTHNQSLRRQ